MVSEHADTFLSDLRAVGLLRSERHLLASLPLTDTGKFRFTKSKTALN
jgi:hypothetical protein